MYRLSAQHMLRMNIHVIIKVAKLCICRSTELIMDEYLIILLRMLEIKTCNEIFFSFIVKDLCST